MRDFIILHTNDLHGRVEGLARISTLAEQIRAENRGVPVLYFDFPQPGTAAEAFFSKLMFEPA